MLSGCAREQPALIYKNDASSEMSCRVEWQATEWGWWCRAGHPLELAATSYLQLSAGGYPTVPTFMESKEVVALLRRLRDVGPKWNRGGMGCGCP